jgi:hypothetical protein
MIAVEFWWEARSGLAGDEVTECGLGTLHFSFLVPEFGREWVLIFELERRH